MLSTLSFDSVSLESWGLYITDAGVYEAPQLDYTSYQIPGRSGDLIVYNGRYRNILVRYPCVIPDNFDENFQKVRYTILSRPRYCEIRDGFFPDRFRMGIYRSGLNPTTKVDRNSGYFDIVFDCAPQWWLDEGQVAQVMQNGGTISNPTMYDAKPILRIGGNGEVTIGDTVITTSGVPANKTCVIDCESGIISDGDITNFSQYVTIDGDLPVLPNGSTEIGLSGASLSIIPRWYEL